MSTRDRDAEGRADKPLATHLSETSRQPTRVQHGGANLLESPPVFLTFASQGSKDTRVQRARCCSVATTDARLLAFNASACSAVLSSCLRRPRRRRIRRSISTSLGAALLRKSRALRPRRRPAGRCRAGRCRPCPAPQSQDPLCVEHVAKRRAGGGEQVRLHALLDDLRGHAHDARGDLSQHGGAHVRHGRILDSSLQRRLGRLSRATAQEGIAVVGPSTKGTSLETYQGSAGCGPRSSGGDSPKEALEATGLDEPLRCGLRRCVLSDAGLQPAAKWRAEAKGTSGACKRVLMVSSGNSTTSTVVPATPPLMSDTYRGTLMAGVVALGCLAGGAASELAILTATHTLQVSDSSRKRSSSSLAPCSSPKRGGSCTEAEAQRT
eukprot:scaffold1259_cov239-Pinguiococcus_pyrenoidosus.AAC.6